MEHEKKYLKTIEEVSDALAAGKVVYFDDDRDKHIIRQPCEICGEKAEAHHDDYNKPLEVRWLCFKHHREWHKIHENPELLEEEK